MRTEKSVLFGAIMLAAAIAFVPVSFAELNPTTQPDPGLPTSSVDGPNAPVVQPPTQPTNVLQRAQAMQEVTQLIQEDIAQNGQPSDFIAMPRGFTPECRRRLPRRLKPDSRIRLGLSPKPQCSPTATRFCRARPTHRRIRATSRRAEDPICAEAMTARGFPAGCSG